MSKRKPYTKIIEQTRSVPELTKDYLDMKKAQGVTYFTLEIQGGILRRFFEAVPDCKQDIKQWKREYNFIFLIRRVRTTINNWTQ